MPKRISFNALASKVAFSFSPGFSLVHKLLWQSASNNGIVIVSIDSSDRPISLYDRTHSDERRFLLSTLENLFSRHPDGIRALRRRTNAAGTVRQLSGRRSLQWNQNLKKKCAT
jgi:hypothetical protein